MGLIMGDLAHPAAHVRFVIYFTGPQKIFPKHLVSKKMVLIMGDLAQTAAHARFVLLRFLKWMIGMFSIP